MQHSNNKKTPYIANTTNQSVTSIMEDESFLETLCGSTFQKAIEEQYDINGQEATDGVLFEMIQGRYPAEEDIQSEKLQSMISLIRDGYHKDTYKQIEKLGCNLDSNLQHDYVRSVLQVNAQVCFSNYITTCIPKGDEHVTALVNDGIKYREQNAKKHTRIKSCSPTKSSHSLM